jgi:16S rRNA (cytidine1402-2'-O)-methyltransferase
VSPARSGGRLVLVGTPLGNLGDLSPRAIETLRDAGVIACEDTRRTGRLLAHAGVTPRRLLVVNAHTEARSRAEIDRLLTDGKAIAVVSDAGMPGISDPGERLVRMAVESGHPVEVVPGPSAVVAALVVSALAADRFCFEGFLPRKGSARNARLEEIAAEPRTVVLYEAPHRLERTLTDLAERCGGDRRVAIARELTKLHEEVWRGSLDEAAAWAAAGGARGELVLVLDGAPAGAPPDDGAIRTALDAARRSGLSARDAATQVAGDLGVPRRRAYALAVEPPSASLSGPSSDSHPGSTD